MISPVWANRNSSGGSPPVASTRWWQTTRRARNGAGQDDYTPGGVNIRPDRATIAYTNLIRHHGRSKKPVVLGGIEASLRRIAHYDYWDDAIRRSILFDAKADILAYGMAEKTVVELAEALKNGADWRKIKGLCYISNTPVPAYIRIAFIRDG